MLVLKANTVVTFVNLCNESRKSGSFDRSSDFELAMEKVSLELLVEVVSIGGGEEGVN